MSKQLDASPVMDLPPFSGLTCDQLRVILDKAAAQRHPAGASIFVEGTAATQCDLSLDGHVRAQRITANGKQVILHKVL